MGHVPGMGSSCTAFPSPRDSLTIYFDHYLRGIDNGWERDTPKVRWATLKFGDVEPVHDIVLKDFPVPDTQYLEFSCLETANLASQTPSAAAVRFLQFRGSQQLGRVHAYLCRAVPADRASKGGTLICHAMRETIL